MKEAARILVVDDEPANIRLLGELLTGEGYGVSVARNGEEALASIAKERPNLVLLDVVMPGLSGYEVCERLRQTAETRLLPVILVTGARPEEERVQGLDAGADEFLTKPVNREELFARVRALLRVESLHRQVESQAKALAEWNEELERRVQDQVSQIDRMNRLKHFFPQHVAELIVAEGSEKMLATRRRQVTVCFIDLRGFTPFSETSEPEEVMEVLSEYYAEMGDVVEQHGGTVERFAGDGMAIFFNAPIEISDPEAQAVRTAIQMRKRYEALSERWRKRGHELGLGIGLANGFATIGAIGFSGRWQYAAIGTVTNLAARLCSDASAGQILTTAKLVSAVEGLVEVEPVGEKNIRGLHRPVSVVQVKGLRESS